jgi:integrase
VATVTLPYLNVYRSNGKDVAFYRRPGVRIRLRDETGAVVDPADQPALIKAWQAAHDAYSAKENTHKAKAEGSKVIPRSIADLISRYRQSPEWREKAPATRTDYEKALKPILDDFGHLPVSGLRKPMVTQMRDRYATRKVPDPADPTNPKKTIKVNNARQANRIVTVLSILLTYSVDPLGWRPDNPALRPKRLKKTTDGYQPWTPEQWDQFQQNAPEEWRFAAFLSLLTAQRGQDVVAMTWGDYDGDMVFVVQQKGGGAVKMWVHVHPDLKPLLDKKRAADRKRDPAPLTILSHSDATPWGVNQFQKAAGKAIKAAGLKGIVWHGLRGAAMSWAAEGGASQKELMALAGHRTSGMSDHYTRKASQKKLARSAVEAIQLPTSRTRKAPNGTAE